MSIKEQIRAEIEQQKAYSEQMIKGLPHDLGFYYVGWMDLASKLLVFLDFLKEQPVSDHHEIEVEFRGEKVTINREFYRDGEMNYSTSEQDDNAIWSVLRAWCEKKGITPFELYPKQPEQPVEGLEELRKEVIKFSQDHFDELHSDMDTIDIVHIIARHFAKWQKKLDDRETADLLAIAHLQGMEQQKSEIPRWHKVKQNGMLDKPTQFLLSSKEGYFFCSGDYISKDGYALFIDELEKLPKEDEK